jgi:hypothetical protein
MLRSSPKNLPGKEGLTMVVGAAASEEFSLSTELITEILDYVNPTDRCVLEAAVQEYRIIARVRFDSPQYTKKPVDYLSSSTLAVSVAQVAHVLIDATVRQRYYPFGSLLSLEHLEGLRQNHELYFADLCMKFRRRYPRAEYWMKIELTNSRRVGLLGVHSLKFEVGDFVSGSFRAVVPLIGYNHE